MKSIEVVAGVLTRTQNGAVEFFATARGYGNYKGFWEFPGGKMEAGETREQALARELREELAVQVEVGDFICTVEHDYPNFHLTMHCFYCSMVGGKLTLLEHEAARWVPLGDLDSLKWCPADIKVVENLKKCYI